MVFDSIERSVAAGGHCAVLASNHLLLIFLRTSGNWAPPPFTPRPHAALRTDCCQSIIRWIGFARDFGETCLPACCVPHAAPGISSASARVDDNADWLDGHRRGQAPLRFETSRLLPACHARKLHHLPRQAVLTVLVIYLKHGRSGTSGLICRRLQGRYTTGARCNARCPACHI